MVEIGSYLGRSASFLLLATRALGVDAHLTSIDPHTGDRQQMERLGVSALPSLKLFEAHMDAIEAGDALTSLVSWSPEAAVTWKGPVDLLYVDGWHSYDAVLEDGRDRLPHLTANGVGVFDDYGRYEEVRRGIAYLVSEGRFTPWGTMFGQAVGGTATAPSAPIAAALNVASEALVRRVHRPR